MPWPKGMKRVFTPEHRANLSRAAKGRRLTQRHKDAVGKSSRGRKQSAETRAMRSAAMKATIAVRGNHWVLGRKASKQERLRRARIQKDRYKKESSPLRGRTWKSPKVAEWHARNREVSLARIANARKHSRWANTKPERIIAGILEELKLSYNAQGRISALRGRPGGHAWDFVLLGYNLLIEVDGCYWHGCPKHYPNSRHARVVQDKRNTAVARRHGWSVLRIWEHDTKQLEYVRSRVVQALHRNELKRKGVA